MATQVIHFDAQHPLWAAYVAHLERVHSIRWALRAGAHNPECRYLGIVAEGDCFVVGHLSLRLQPIDLPSPHTLMEMFVNTFAVEPAYQRRGYGRALQEAALRLSGDLNC